MTRLKTLQSTTSRFAAFLNPHARVDILSQIDVTDVLETLDYGRLSTPVTNASWNTFNPSNIPSPVYDDFLNLFPLGYTRPFASNTLPEANLNCLPSESLSSYPASQPWLEEFQM